MQIRPQHISRRKNRLGYTLMEITITIVILGVIASLAVPKYNTLVEKVKTEEALVILSAIHKAQIAHKLEYGKYAEGFINVCNTTSCLEVNVPLSPYFDQPSLQCASAPCDGGVQEVSCGGANYGILANIQRSSSYPNQYILFLLEDGRVICHDGFTANCDGICLKLGFESI